MDEARDLRQQGIRAAKAGQKDEARQLLQQSIRLEPDNEAAWLWLASVARDSRERLFCLQKLLEINPTNEMALKAIDAATQAAQAAAPPSTVKRLPNAPVTKPPTPDITTQMPGVPVPMPDRIAEAQRQVEPVVRRYLAPLPATTRWVHKTRRRAGERDILVYRMYVLAGVLGVLLLLLGVGVIMVQTNDDVREIVLGPSATPTPSPTITPTNTPGLTPTPSPTPRISPTPSATVPPNVAAASPPALPHATAIYPQILERGVYDSILLLNQGQIDRALPTLDYERRLTFDTNLNANPYYYQAVGLTAQGRYSEAIGILDEAADRVSERTEDNAIRAFLNAGYAQVYWAQHQQAVADGNPSLAQSTLNEATDKAQAAIDGDRKLVPPYLVLAQVLAAGRRFGDAIETLNSGLNVPELNGNTELIMQKAEIYFQQRNYDQALYQAFLALYTDPSTEAAYEMKIRVAMARNRPGDAVLAAQDYLYYYPGSTEAYSLLGKAREAEHKDDLALAVYDQGLNGSSRDEFAQQMLEARGGIYARQGRYELAQADYDRLYGINGSAQAQALRMQAALQAGDYTQALADADDLAGQEVVSEAELNLVRGRALIEQSEDADSATYTRAAQVLTQAVAGAADDAARATAYEYLARAQLELNDDKAALTSINSAIQIGETGSRHYWRGRIYETSGEKQAAISEYEWVLAWSEIFPYPFRAETQDRLDALSA